MIETPLRHRATSWVVRGAGVRGRPELSGPARSRVVLRRAAGVLLRPDGPLEVYGAPPEPIPLPELEDCTGEWVGLLADEEERTWVALSDFHGFGHLYYHLHRRGSRQDVYLATTLDGLVDRLRADGITLSVNWPYALTTLASNHVLLRSHWSRETLVEGVSCLGPDEMLVIDGQGVGTVERPMTTDPAGRSYDELLEAGIARSAALLQGLLAAGWPELRLYASGGKDNRGVQALLHRAGVLPHVRVSAADPLRWADAAGRRVLWEDLAVTDRLRERLGLEWSQEPEFEDRMLSWDESLQLHQSYYAGGQWNFPAERQLRWPEAPHVALRGGAGELLRSGHRSIIGQPWWNGTMKRKREAVAQDLATLADLVVEPGVNRPGELVAAGRELLTRSFRPLPSAGINEQLNSHYRLHRNRSHFGHVRHSLDRRSLAVYPLAVPELLRAAYLRPYWERHQGQVTFDLIERIDPSLNRLPFAEGSWPQAVWDRRDPSFVPPAAPSGPFTREDFPSYFDQEDRNHARRGRWSGPHRFETRTQTAVSAVSLLWRLHDTVGDPSVLPSSTTASLAEHAGTGRISAAVTVARVTSLLRALDGPGAGAGPDVEVSVRPRGWRGWRPGRGPAPVSAEDRPGTGAASAPAPSVCRTQAQIVAGAPGGGLVPFAPDPSTPRAVFCHAWVEGGRVLAQRVGDLPDGAALRHTFSLLRGGQPVAEVTTDDDVATVADPAEPGSYRVRLTATRLDRPEVAYVVQSMPVRVEPSSP